MSNDLIVIDVYGDEQRAQHAWRMISATFRINSFHADAVLVAGPVYVKSDDGYIEVTQQGDKR